MSITRRLWFALGLVLVFVIGSIVTSRVSAVSRSVATGPRVEPSASVAAWYCAEGTSNPNGRADEEIVMGNVATTPSRATVTVFGGSGVPAVRRRYRVDPGQVVRFRVADISPLAEPGVVVEVSGGATAVEHRIQRGTDGALGPCAREPVQRADFAGGTTLKGAETWLALFNPFPDDAIVDVRATTGDGVRAPGALQGIVVPRFTRVSVPLHDLVSRVDLLAISTSVRRGRVVAEESVALDGTDGRAGLAMSLGEGRARQWRFPVGVTGSGRQERLVVANPESRDAQVTVSFALDAAAAVEPVTLIVPATTALAVDLTRVPPDIGFSTRVRSSQPIVAEVIGATGAPQGADVRGLASDLGFGAGARRWVVVPARLDVNSVDELALVSTDGHRHRIQVVRVDQRRERVVARATVPSVGRVAVDLTKVVGSSAIAVELHADGPVVVERVSARPGITRSHAVVYAAR